MLENDNLKIDLNANIFVQNIAYFHSFLKKIFQIALYCREDAFIHITIESSNIKNGTCTIISGYY